MKCTMGNDQAMSQEATDILRFAFGRFRRSSTTFELDMHVGGDISEAGAIDELHRLGYCGKPYLGGRMPIMADLTHLGFKVAEGL